MPMHYPTDEQIREMIDAYESDMLAEIINELAVASA